MNKKKTVMRKQTKEEEKNILSERYALRRSVRFRWKMDNSNETMLKKRFLKQTVK